MKAHVENEKRIRISACTIAKNEAENIARSIESYRPFVDEIIVVDTGSTDDTVKIAEDLGAKVLYFEWCGDFSAAKNVALGAASGDWIIFLDADEYFDESSRRNIRKLIETADKKGCNIVAGTMVNIDAKTQIVISTFNQYRIFKAGCRYVYPVHEDIVSPFPRRFYTATRSELCLYHTGYSTDRISEKSDRNFGILSKTADEEKNPVRRAIYQSYLAECLAFMDKDEEAYNAATTYLGACKKLSIPLSDQKLKCYIILLVILRRKKTGDEEIEQWISESLNDFPGHPELLFEEGRLRQSQKLFSEATGIYDTILRTASDYHAYLCAIDNKMAEVYMRSGVCYEAMHRPSEAIDRYVKALDFGSTIYAATRIVAIIKGMPEQEILKFLESLFTTANKEKQLRIFTGILLNYQEKLITHFYSLMKLKENTKVFDAGVMARIAAGKGNFSGASGFFLIQHEYDKSPTSAMCALMCAVMSPDGSSIDNALKAADPIYALALGLREKDENILQEKDVSSLAKMISEAGRMRGGKYAEQLARKAAGLAGPGHTQQLIRELDEAAEFAGALTVAEQMPYSHEAVFLEGYYTYRLGRFDEAAVLLEAAKHLGSGEKALEPLLARIRELQAENDAGKMQKAPGALMEQAIANIGRDDYIDAVLNIREYRRSVKGDPEAYSVEAVACYKAGLYRKAAASIEAGLLHDEENPDLLINGGDIYATLKDKDRASRCYQKAAEFCSDEESQRQIQMAILALKH